MNRDDIIKMLDWHHGAADYSPSGLLSRIEQVLAAAVSAEREACAKIADMRAATQSEPDRSAESIAWAIRRRGAA